MAEDQAGVRKDYVAELAPWTKLFTAFKVALDPKKLLLAAAGILSMALGWYLLAVIFFAMGGGTKPPQWSEYPGRKSAKAEERQAAWQDYKADLARWNLLYEMAGAPPTAKDPRNPTQEIVAPVAYGTGDVADSPEEYEAIEAEWDSVKRALGRLDEPVILANDPNTSGNFLQIGKLDAGGRKLMFEAAHKEDMEKLLAGLQQGKSAHQFTVRDIKIVPRPKEPVPQLFIGDYEVVLKTPDPVADIAFIRDYKESARTVEDIRAEARAGLRNARIVQKILDLRQAKFKPYGRLRTMPWFEDRGPNPYLLVTGNVRSGEDGDSRYVPWERGHFMTWLLGDQLPVLLEPLVKFFRPIVYLFDPAGGWLNRIYLFLVILWSLAVWALFGGAITRIASVQVARANERVGMVEALRFVWARYKSYFCAPLFPLIFLAVIIFVLVIFGLIEAYFGFVGDLIGPFLWPLVFLAGLIMAVVLVGLVGYPLMYTTISAEGSDSFDAISRSYSYVYQAPWQYLWYSLLAVVYGAVLVFFVGFMGSLLVYLSKWGVTQAPFTPADREPSYLFQYAPTSYGWRDLLLHKSPNARTDIEVNNRGQEVPVTNVKETSKAYELTWNNHWASWVMAVWLDLLFLLVIGFAYSYFWSASTIVYLLMRRKVDDTELDEIHLEEEPEQPWTPPAPPPSPAAEPAKSAMNPVQMVEAPSLRNPMPPPNPPPVTPPAAEPMSTSEAGKEQPRTDGEAGAGGSTQ
jgi:hypothetical protein